MAKRDRAAELLDALSAATSAGPSVALPLVKKGLAHAAGPVVERAAKAAANLNLDAIGPLLGDALGRLLDGDYRNADAAVTVLDAMRQLRADDRDGYRRALRCTWEAPGYGGSDEVGAHVRAAACRALVESGDAGAPLLLAGLLFEQTRENAAARIAAAQGLGICGDAEAVEVLRIKLTRAVADEPDVLGECCGAIARIDAPDADVFLRAYLGTASIAVLEGAAVPIGEARRPSSWPLLRAIRERLLRADREAAAMYGLAVVREAAATGLLIERLRDGPPNVAQAAAEALGLLAGDVEVARRAGDACAARPDGRSLLALMRAAAP